MAIKKLKEIKEFKEFKKTPVVSFSKMQACGNDFVVLNDTAEQWVGQESALARAVCDRHFGIGADGLMVIRQHLMQSDVFHLVFVNSNGLIGEMCGNGARCVARFVRDHGWCVQNKWTLRTAAGVVRVEFLNTQDIQLALPSPVMWQPVREFFWENQSWVLHGVHLGPPHVVCVLPTLDVLNQAPLAHLGPVVRYHDWYAPDGCNFNIVARLSDNCVQLRTYERGVEEETLGCGTGAAASVWVLHHQLGWVLPETTVMTKSGEPIDIDVRDPLRPLLTGRAHAIGHGCLDDNWLARHHLIPNDEKTF